jgi:hypothetical protein
LKYILPPLETGESPNGLRLERAGPGHPSGVRRDGSAERELTGHHSSAFAPERFFERVIRSKQ